MAEKRAEKAKKNNGSGHLYDASSITVLEGLEPVRKRPGMYIGTTGPDGLHHLITEIFDNARDEAMGGFANDIEVALLPGNRVRVVDNGRGIPVDTHKQTKVSALETIMTTLHAGGKFGGEGYKVSGGLHGVGASVVNALSSWMEVVVHRDGGAYRQEYERGEPKAKVKKIDASALHGTIVSFEPDTKIFPEISFSWDKVVSHMREQAYLVKGLRITVLDARGLSANPVRSKSPLATADLPKANRTSNGTSVFYLRELELDVPSQSFYFEGGLSSLVAFYNEPFKPVHRRIFVVEKPAEGVEEVAVALQYADDISSRVLAFANNIGNPEGGTHITGFKTALTRTLNTYARNAGLAKESDDNFTGDDVLEGLTAVVSVKLREIQFEGQTKAKLGSVEAQGAVATVFGEAFSAFLEEHPEDARAIIGKVVLALRARKAAKAAKDSVLRKGALEGMTLPGKLADCETKSAEEAELFVVEGDSAGGCFSGDTQVALLDGRNLSFKELVEEEKQGKRNYCYTIDTQGAVQAAPILSPRVTRKHAQVLKITLDNGEEIVCTPDHRFMLRDGLYKQARELTHRDSLMPLRRQISKLGKRITIKGYELVWSPGEHRWIFTHLISDRFNIARGIYQRGENEAVHHIDFNKRNNNPDNVVRWDRMAHFFFHTKNLDKTIHREDIKEKARKAHLQPAYREKVRQIMSTPAMKKMSSARAKRQWESEDYKKYMTEKFLAFYHSNESYRRKNNALLLKSQREYWAQDAHRGLQSQRTAAFFATHPEHREALRECARTEWSDRALLDWRREQTKKQWTPEFRQKRKSAYNQTYLRKALAVLHDIWRNHGRIDEALYNSIRKEKKDKSLIRLQTITDRFFGGERVHLDAAVANFNHRIKKVERVTERHDVYDLEVPGTHNFALASGVFVHNSGKQGRDRRTQAVLPLKGKILNVERARLDKILGFAEIKSLVIALGTGISDSFDVSKLRYHKIIIATDADVDGAHIRTLLLTLFYRYFRPLIDGGFIYIAQPPLYKIKRGKEFFYAFSDEEKAKLLRGAEVAEESSAPETSDTEMSAREGGRQRGNVGTASVQRYKGLGEMNPEELWETTMDPARRTLKKVRVEDAQEADKTFDILMGEDVAARKAFIQTNATRATLDI